MARNRILLRNLKKDKKAISPAISMTILTAAVVTMLIVAVTFANNYLNARVAEIEFDAMKQFMQTIGLQIDDVAWIPGRTQTIRYASKYGHVKVEFPALNYSFYFDNNLLASFTVGAILFNIPVSAYSLGNGYFDRLFPSSDSFLQYNASAPICRVFVVEKMPMLDGGYARIVVCPLVRQINSVVNNITYVNLYLPDLKAGPNPQYSQSVTLTGKNVNRTVNNANNLTIGLGFPNSLGAGLTADFFNFARTSETLNVPSNSVVQIYTGEVIVSLGLFT